MRIRSLRIFSVGVAVLLGWPVESADAAPGRRRSRRAAANAPAGEHFPALGAAGDRRVDVAWNRFYDHAGLSAILRQLNQAFPDLTQLYSIGKSVDGRELWCLEVSAKSAGDPGRKPAMYIDGNIHGNEVQGGEAVAYTAWYLLHQYGKLPRVTELLNDRTFYLIPTINPDGRDRWFHQAQTAHSSRTGVRPVDNDRDGKADEDDVDDLNGDGSITMMRKRDPNGRFKPHPDYPEYLMVRAKPDEPGEYVILGREGIDNDGDGRVNEDGVGGYDPNRNWGFDWQPHYVQRGAQGYPFSLPESRAIADFVIAHPNIAAMQSFHNAGGMILRGPGREGGEVQRADERIWSHIGKQGEKLLPFYNSWIVHKDLYTVWGGEIDWFYGARGILAFTNELWTDRNLYRTGKGRTSDEKEAEFLKYMLMGDGVVEWEPYDHPTYGKIEVGGTKKTWGRVPPSFLIEEELHRNMAFTLYHADQMPLVRIREVTVEPLARRLFKVWVTIENNRMIPTRTAQDVTHKISAPDVVTLEGRRAQVLASGRVTDQYFKRVTPTKHRFERVELDTVPGMSAERVQFIVKGGGRFEVTFDSQKGGKHVAEGRLR